VLHSLYMSDPPRGHSPPKPPQNSTFDPVDHGLTHRTRHQTHFKTAVPTCSHPSQHPHILFPQRKTAILHHSHTPPQRRTRLTLVTPITRFNDVGTISCRGPKMFSRTSSTRWTPNPSCFKQKVLRKHAISEHHKISPSDPKNSL
jgi:hypothetical protein